MSASEEWNKAKTASFFQSIHQKLGAHLLFAVYMRETTYAAKFDRDKMLRRETPFEFCFCLQQQHIFSGWNVNNDVIVMVAFK